LARIPDQGALVADHNHITPPNCPGCDELLDRERLARLAAEAASHAKDDFFLNLSHELRGPLNAITSWVYLLRSGDLGATDRIRALDIIERSANAEARLITDMLDVSRMMSGQLRIEPLAVELSSLVAESADAVRPAAEHRNIALAAWCDAPDCVVAADPDRLRQVVQNLLINAINYTPNGGKVAVRVATTGDRATIAVSDTGRGITSSLLPHVFERFRRGDHTPDHPHGLGLGLSIVQHIVELHGGSVAAKSDGEGLGATFTVTLPLSGPEAAANASARA
jgi:signal transduction histidine kinase